MNVQCEWEWDGAKWIQRTGPAACPTPLPPRDAPGTIIRTMCAEPAADGIGLNENELVCCAKEECCSTL